MGFLARVYQVALTLSVLPALAACQTGGSTSDSLQDETGAGAELAGNEPAGQAQEQQEAATPPSEPEDSGHGHFNLGPLLDDDLKDVVYQGLQDTLGAPKVVGQGEEEITELGESGHFNFNVVKLLRGKDDISGEGGAADGMDVEVTGWYKRSVRNSAEQQDPACTSFDAIVAISKQGDAWHLTPGETQTYGREDREDCF